MKSLIFLFAVPFLFTGCMTAPKPDNNAMLEKYPGCYHKNQKIVAKCIERNEKGTPTTAVELENTQFPGQYK